MWQRTGRREPEESRDADFNSSQDGVNREQGGYSGTHAEREADLHAKGGGSWGREDSSSNWEKAGGPEARMDKLMTAEEQAKAMKGKGPEEEIDLRAKLQKKQDNSEFPQGRPRATSVVCGITPQKSAREGTHVSFVDLTIMIPMIAVVSLSGTSGLNYVLLKCQIRASSSSTSMLTTN